MPEKPLVSICVPTYNRADKLRKSLPKILRQDYAPLEILISDNGSTDETEAVCREAAGRDSRIRYTRHPKNIGLYENHNFLIDQARGEFLCFFHDHDEREDSMIREYVSFLERNPGAGVVCSDWKLIDEEGKELGDRFYRVAEVMPGLNYIDRTFRTGSSAIATPGAMVRRSALGGIRFNEQGAIGFGDFPVWFQVAERHDVGHLSKVLWYWRQDPGSQSSQALQSMAQHYEENLSRYCDDYLGRWPQNASRVARWRKEIRQYLFWASAYEIGLYFRKNGSSGTEELWQKLERMRGYRTGFLQHLLFPFIQAGARLKAAPLFIWAAGNSTFFRRLLGLC